MTDLSAPTFSKGDALLTLMFGVVMPSFDIFSDIHLSVKLFNRSCDEHEHKYWNCDNDQWILRDIRIQNTFGWWIILIPVLINLIFTIPQFLRLEKSLKQRLLTLHTTSVLPIMASISKLESFVVCIRQKGH